MERLMDNATGSLIGTLDRASEKQLARGMHFPIAWDPYFRDYMTVQDVLHYATQHYQHHRPAHLEQRTQGLMRTGHGVRAPLTQDVSCIWSSSVAAGLPGRSPPPGHGSA